MKKIQVILGLILITASLGFVSCDNDDDYENVMSALVTVKTDDNGNTFFQVDKNTVVYPENIKGQIFNGKEVRALTQYEYDDDDRVGNARVVEVLWLDSILTKPAVRTYGDGVDSQYGNDAVEIVRHWTTVAEDGYVTLRFLTQWGFPATKHRVTLVAGVNPKEPFEFDFRHNANGDYVGRLQEGMVAFNIKEVIAEAGRTPDHIILNYDSYDGRRQIVLPYDPVPVSAAPQVMKSVMAGSSVE